MLTFNARFLNGLSDILDISLIQNINKRSKRIIILLFVSVNICDVEILLPETKNI